MLDSVDVARFQRELRAMCDKADDGAGLAQVLELLHEAEEGLPDVVARLRSRDGGGFSWSELAREVGITKSAMAGTYGVGNSNLHRHLATAVRRLGGGLDGEAKSVRLTVANGAVYGSLRRGPWRLLRLCVSTEEAEWVASRYSDVQGWRIVPNPSDFDGSAQ